MYMQLHNKKGQQKFPQINPPVTNDWSVSKILDYYL